MEFFNLNRVKDTPRLYQNGVTLHLVREKSSFSYKNKCVYTLNNLAYVINKKYIHQSIFGKFGKIRKSSAVRYFTLPQCGAVRYKVLVTAVNLGVLDSHPAYAGGA